MRESIFAKRMNTRRAENQPVLNAGQLHVRLVLSKEVGDDFAVRMEGLGLECAGRIRARFSPLHAACYISRHGDF